MPLLKFQEKFSHSCDLWVGGSGLHRKHGCLHNVPLSLLTYCTFLRAWNRLIRAENFQKLFEAADEDVNFSHQRLVDLLTLSAAKGGTQEFADALRLVVKEGVCETGCLVMEFE